MHRPRVDISATGPSTMLPITGWRSTSSFVNRLLTLIVRLPQPMPQNAWWATKVMREELWPILTGVREARKPAAVSLASISASL